MIRIALLIGLALAVCSACNGDEPIASPPAPSAALQDLALAALWEAADAVWHEAEHSRYIEVMEAVLALDPKNLEAYINAGWLLWSQGREEEAVAMYTRAVEQVPDNYESWFEFGMYYRKHVRDNEKARDMFLRAVQCEPHPNFVERQLAHTYEDLGQIADAFKVWQDLAKRFPEDGVIQFNLNLFLKKHGI